MELESRQSLKLKDFCTNAKSKQTLFFDFSRLFRSISCHFTAASERTF